MLRFSPSLRASAPPRENGSGIENKSQNSHFPAETQWRRGRGQPHSSRNYKLRESDTNPIPVHISFVRYVFIPPSLPNSCLSIGSALPSDPMGFPMGPFYRPLEFNGTEMCP